MSDLSADESFNKSPNEELLAEQYVVNRLEQYATWYDTRAVKMKFRYQAVRVVTAVGAVLVPVLANLPGTLELGIYHLNASRILTTVISTLVAVLISLEAVFRHREQWRNYRTTEQYLRSQKILFEQRADEFEQLDDQSARRRLIANVESAIKGENEVTLEVLTRTGDTTITTASDHREK